MASFAHTQTFTIIAQDPSVKVERKNPETEAIEKRILTARITIPSEELAPGPRGYRVQVIDYDSSTGTLCAPLEYRMLENGQYNDPFMDEPDETLLSDPLFHAQNVYAIVMRTLSRFEYALGRRVSWSFHGHQLQVAPHAFTEANAFYSKRDRALLFGYFPRMVELKDSVESRYILTCLSHDIVVHETTHALVDGLRERYIDPSSPEQAGFHEGFADIVALLSIFSLPKVVASIIDKKFGLEEGQEVKQDPEAIKIKDLQVEELRESLLLGLAKEFGEQMNDSELRREEKTGRRMGALRRSVELKPDKDDPPIKQTRFREPHKRGEVLVAAVMNAFLEVWVNRLKGLGNRRREAQASRGLRRESTEKQSEEPDDKDDWLDRQRVVEEGATIADYLLTMVIRALDYCPPSDLEFCDFLSAMLTADREIRPDDSKYKFRQTLLESFSAYGMEPTSKGDGKEKGVWEPPGCVMRYDRAHLEPLMRDKDEMFRFIWENRVALGLEEEAYTRVLSVRPCLRVNPEDGFSLRETVAEYHQILTLKASELKHLGIKIPQAVPKEKVAGALRAGISVLTAMPKEQDVTLYGGGSLILDEFGQVKFHIRNRLLNPERQTRRLEYLWRYGAFKEDFRAKDSQRFAQMHRQRFGTLSMESGGLSGTLSIESEDLIDDDYLEEEEAATEEFEETGADEKLQAG